MILSPEEIKDCHTEKLLRGMMNYETEKLYDEIGKLKDKINIIESAVCTIFREIDRKSKKIEERGDAGEKVKPPYF